MGDDGASRSTPHWPLALAAVPVVLVLYVLSIGPVLWLVYRCGVQQRIVPVALIVYTPLTWICDRLGLNSELLWYIGLWIPLVHA